MQIQWLKHSETVNWNRKSENLFENMNCCNVAAISQYEQKAQLACGKERAPVFVLSHQIPGSLPCTVPWLEIRPSWSTIEEFEAIRAKTKWQTRQSMHCTATICHIYDCQWSQWHTDTFFLVAKSKHFLRLRQTIWTKVYWKAWWYFLHIWQFCLMDLHGGHFNVRNDLNQLNMEICLMFENQYIESHIYCILCIYIYI